MCVDKTLHNYHVNTVYKRDGAVCSRQLKCSVEKRGKLFIPDLNDEIARYQDGTVTCHRNFWSSYKRTPNMVKIKTSWTTANASAIDGINQQLIFLLGELQKHNKHTRNPKLIKVYPFLQQNDVFKYFWHQYPPTFYILPLVTVFSFFLPLFPPQREFLVVVTFDRV